MYVRGGVESGTVVSCRVDCRQIDDVCVAMNKKQYFQIEENEREMTAISMAFVPAVSFGRIELASRGSSGPPQSSSNVQRRSWIRSWSEECMFSSSKS